MIHPRWLMDPEGFRSLRDCSAIMANGPVDTLVDTWNTEVAQAVDMIAPTHPLRTSRAKLAPWFSGELMAAKQSVQWLERRWRTRAESDRLLVEQNCELTL